MSYLLSGLGEALQRIAHLDPELLGALATTLKVSLASTAVASAVSVPLGFFLASRSFRRRRYKASLS